MDSIYLLDQYVTTKAGEPFRLFPFGRLVKNGKAREITRELASKFKLPHFKPAIKLGSHEDATPAGGFITELEVRDDGLYALPEWNEKGVQATTDGAYRYQSPEVIWEGGGLEDPNSGDVIEGPLVIGVALLHTPHLGNAAALYSVSEILDDEEARMETVQVPQTFWDKFMSKVFIEREPDPEPQKEPQVDNQQVEKFEALQKERDELSARLTAIEAEKEKATLLDHYRAEMKETKLDGDDEIVTILAGLDTEIAEKIVQHFKALSAQIDDTKILDEKGADGEGVGDDPVNAFDAAVKAVAAERNVDYLTALQQVSREKPELYEAYKGGK